MRSIELFSPNGITNVKYYEYKCMKSRFKLDGMRIMLQFLTKQLLTSVIENDDFSTYFKDEVKKLCERVSFYIEEKKENVISIVEKEISKLICFLESRKVIYFAREVDGEYHETHIQSNELGSFVTFSEKGDILFKKTCDYYGKPGYSIDEVSYNILKDNFTLVIDERDMLDNISETIIVDYQNGEFEFELCYPSLSDGILPACHPDNYDFINIINSCLNSLSLEPLEEKIINALKKSKIKERKRKPK